MDYENPDNDQTGSGSGTPSGQGSGTTPGSTGGSSPDTSWWANAIAGDYSKFLGRDANPDEIQNWINGALGAGKDYGWIQNQIANSAEAMRYAYNRDVRPPGDQNGGGVQGGGGLVDPFTRPAPGYIHAPTFTPPTFIKAPAFVAPTIQDALNDPGYNFGLQQGEQALQNSAAAGGVLNSGNTLRNILEFGNNYATTKYNDLFNRKLAEYGTNYGSQYIDPYKFSYQAALDTFQPQMADWTAHNAFNWNDYLQSYNQFRNRQQDSIDAAVKTTA